MYDYVLTILMATKNYNLQETLEDRDESLRELDEEMRETIERWESRLKALGFLGRRIKALRDLEAVDADMAAVVVAASTPVPAMPPLPDDDFAAQSYAELQHEADTYCKGSEMEVDDCPPPPPRKVLKVIPVVKSTHAVPVKRTYGTLNELIHAVQEVGIINATAVVAAVSTRLWFLSGHKPSLDEIAEDLFDADNAKKWRTLAQTSFLLKLGKPMSGSTLLLFAYEFPHLAHLIGNSDYRKKIQEAAAEIVKSSGCMRLGTRSKLAFYVKLCLIFNVSSLTVYKRAKAGQLEAKAG